MFLGLANVLTSIRRNFIPWIKDGLKLHYFFRQNSDLTISHASTGSSSFDGVDDYLKIDSVIGDLGSSCTFSAWIYRNNTSDYHYIFDARNNSGTGYVQGNSGNTFINKSSGTIYVDGVASSTLATGGWHHLAVTGMTINITQDVMIGVHLGGTDYNFPGKMCNVGIWDRTLSASEVQGIMYKQYSDLGSVDKTNLVSWWGLDDTSLGSELVSNGDCSSDSFSKESGWTYDSTNDQYDSNQLSGGNAITQNIGIVAYASYEITFTVSNYVSGGVKANAGAYISGTPRTANGTYTETIQANHASSNAILYIMANSGFVGSVDDISVKAVSSGDSQGSNDGLIVGATTNSTIYGDNAPQIPRILDVATPKQAVQLADGSTSFDGSNDYISVADDSTLDITGAITVSAWIKIDSFPTAEDGIVTKCDNASGAGYSLYSSSTGNIVIFAPRLFDSEKAETGALSTGVWYHIVGTHSDSANENKIYVDGSLVDTTADTNSMVANNEPLDIGRITQDSTRTFDGSIANVSIHSSALTQSQVQELMFTEKYAGLSADLKTNLVSWYYKSWE